MTVSLADRPGAIANPRPLESRPTYATQTKTSTLSLYDILQRALRILGSEIEHPEDGRLVKSVYFSVNGVVTIQTAQNLATNIGIG